MDRTGKPNITNQSKRNYNEQSRALRTPRCASPRRPRVRDSVPDAVDETISEVGLISDTLSQQLSHAVQLHQSGRLAEALAIYQRLLQDSPDHPDLCHLIGLVEHQTGNHAAAVQWIQKAIALAPNSYVFHANLGECYRRLGEWQSAITHLQRAIALQANFAPAHNSLGVVLREIGRGAEAIACYQRAAQIDPKFVEPHVNLGRVLRDEKQHDAARRHCERALQLQPNNAIAHNNLANIFDDQGHIEQAQAHYRRAIEINPRYGQVYSNYAHSRRFVEADLPELQQMERVLADPKLRDEDRSHIHFALGKANNDLGRWDTAFEHYRHGNQLTRVRFRMDAFGEYVDAIMAAYQPELFGKLAPLGCRDASRIFIVGMPRSGTSLIEQILASHPDVAGVGERKEIAQMTERLPALLGQDYPRGISRLNAAQVTELSKSYLDTMRRASGAATRTVDKMMTNFLHLGLIALLFPKATLVHSVRHSWDTCLSCYFQDFSHRPGWAGDLGVIAEYYKHYRRLMEHWSNVLPIAIHNVRYEELVTDQERTTRELLRHCHLDWNAACLEFHRTDRVVQTASNWQVRQPLNTRSIDRWRRYEKHLDPLRNASLVE